MKQRKDSHQCLVHQIDFELVGVQLLVDQQNCWELQTSTSGVSLKQHFFGDGVMINSNHQKSKILLTIDKNANRPSLDLEEFKSWCWPSDNQN